MSVVFVPVAFSEDEALHLLGAARAVIDSGTQFGAGVMKQMAPLAQAMMKLAEATDAAREKAKEKSA